MSKRKDFNTISDKDLIIGLIEKRKSSLSPDGAEYKRLSETMGRLSALYPKADVLISIQLLDKVSSYVNLSACELGCSQYDMVTSAIKMAVNTVKDKYL